MKGRVACGFEASWIDMQPYLQHKAEVSWSFVFALKVFAVVDVYVVELDEADEVTGRLKGNKRRLFGLGFFFFAIYLFLCQLNSISTLQMQ